MWIILKFTLKKLKEHKFRTFLIIFSITLSVALLFASLAIQDTVSEMYLNTMKRSYGSAEIAVSPGEDSPSDFFRSCRAEAHRDKFEYVVSYIAGGAYYQYGPRESINVNLMGYELNQLQQFNPITMIEKAFDQFKGNSVLISNKTAADYGLKIGDDIKLEINGYDYRFFISGIVASEGLFQPDNNAITIVANREKLAMLYGARGRANRIYVKTNESTGTEEGLRLLEEEYPRYQVRITIDPEEALAFTRQMTTTFVLMLPLVVFISIFIIYTSFKVITMERLPIIGTFRSIGATRKMTDILLLSESLFYGIFGGVFGVLLGFGILYIMMQTMSYDEFNDIYMKVEMVYSSWHILISFGGAVTLSLISSLIPIIKISKIPVKDIVLNNIRSKVKKSSLKLYLGLLFLLMAVLIPTFVPQSIALIVDIVAMVLLGSAVILLVPYLTNILVRIFEKTYSLLPGNEGILAAKNLHDNKSIMNNISLLTIGIAAILMITNISNSVGIEVLSVYNDGKFDIMTYISGADRRISSSIRSIDGVSSVYKAYHAGGVDIAGENASINIYGSDGKEFFDYWDFDFLGNKDSILEGFTEARNIILTRITQEKYGYQTGDIITLETVRGDKPYRIVGFVDSLMNLGSVAFANQKYFKRDMELSFYDDIYIRTNQDPELVNQMIKDRFSRGRYIWSMPKETLKESEMSTYDRLLGLLTGFSYIIMIIGIVGIFNNFLVGLMSRKRVIAVMRSVGMSKYQLIKMLFLESLTSGLIGGLIGCLGGILFIKLAEFMLADINIPMTIHYLPSMFGNLILVGALISVIASISPAIKTSRSSIIDSIKYE
ncbi:MAG: ABC transporter permease [Halanaerobiales bacterium]